MNTRFSKGLRTGTLFLLVLIICLWINGFLPKRLTEWTVNRHVEAEYSERNLVFKGIEYSSVHGAYLVYYLDHNGKNLNFLAEPFNIRHDPLNLP